MARHEIDVEPMSDPVWERRAKKLIGQGQLRNPAPKTAFKRGAAMGMPRKIVRNTLAWMVCMGWLDQRDPKRFRLITMWFCPDCETELVEDPKPRKYRNVWICPLCNGHDVEPIFDRASDRDRDLLEIDPERD